MESAVVETETVGFSGSSVEFISGVEVAGALPPQPVIKIAQSSIMTMKRK
jgi:hypothetical protein